MIEIRNLTRQKINKKDLLKLAKKVLKRENRVLNVSIVLVGEKRIRTLNRKYRKKDKVTDVLSFGDGLNEIVICLSRVKEQAKISFKKELAQVLVHGLLHVLGHKHSELMFKKQSYYLLNYG